MASTEMNFESNAREHIGALDSPESRKLYLGDLAAWLLFCHLSGCDENAPLLVDATAFRDAMKERYAPATVRRRLSALSSMYDYYGTGANPFKSKRLGRPKADEVAVTPEFTAEQAQAILAAAAEEAKRSLIGLRDLALMRAIYETGMRVSTACGMRRDAIREIDGKHFLITTVKRKGRVEIVLPDESMRAISAWLNVASAHQSPWVFPRLGGKKPITTKAAHMRVRTYGERVGIKNAGPHRFRAAYITDAITAGIPLRDIQASVHHSSITTTMRYDRGARGQDVAKALAEHRRKK